MCLILASPSYSLQGIVPNKPCLCSCFVRQLALAFVFSARHSQNKFCLPPSCLLNENVLWLVVVWVGSLQQESAFMSLTAKLHKILE